MLEETDTSNRQMVGVTGAGLITVLAPQQQMTKTEALLHAAWIVAIADDDDDFSEVLEAVRNT